MSRQRVEMLDGRLMVIGWDPAFQTWFAILYDDHDEDADPRAVIGYHPAEQNLLRHSRPDAKIGEYPIPDDRLVEMLTGTIPELFGIDPVPAEEQDSCWICKQPPWVSNPNCSSHPFDRLKRS